MHWAGRDEAAHQLSDGAREPIARGEGMHDNARFIKDGSEGRSQRVGERRAEGFESGHYVARSAINGLDPGRVRTFVHFHIAFRGRRMC